MKIKLVILYHTIQSAIKQLETVLYKSLDDIPKKLINLLVRFESLLIFGFIKLSLLSSIMWDGRFAFVLLQPIEYYFKDQLFYYITNTNLV